MPQSLSGISRKLLSLTPAQRAHIRGAASAARSVGPSPLRPATAPPASGVAAAAAHGGAVAGATPPLGVVGLTAVESAPRVSIGGGLSHEMHAWRGDPSGHGAEVAQHPGAYAALERRPSGAHPGARQPHDAWGHAAGSGAHGGANGVDGVAGEPGAEVATGSHYQPLHSATTPPVLAAADADNGAAWQPPGGCTATRGTAGTAPGFQFTQGCDEDDGGGGAWQGAPMPLRVTAVDAAEFGGFDEGDEGDEGDWAEGAGGAGGQDWGEGAEYEAWGWEAGADDAAGDGGISDEGGGDGDLPDAEADDAAAGAAAVDDTGAAADGGEGGTGPPVASSGARALGAALSRYQQEAHAALCAGREMQGPGEAAVDTPAVATPGEGRGNVRAASTAAARAAPATRAAPAWDFDDELRWAEEQEEAEAQAAAAQWEEEPDQDVRPDAGATAFVGGAHGVGTGGGVGHLQQQWQQWPTGGHVGVHAQHAQRAWPQDEVGQGWGAPAAPADLRGHPGGAVAGGDVACGGDAHAAGMHAGGWDVPPWQHQGNVAGGHQAAGDGVRNDATGFRGGGAVDHSPGFGGAARWAGGGVAQGADVEPQGEEGYGWQDWGAQQGQHGQQGPQGVSTAGTGGDGWHSNAGAHVHDHAGGGTASGVADVGGASARREPGGGAGAAQRMEAGSPIDLTEDAGCGAAAGGPGCVPARAPNAFDALRRGQAAAGQHGGAATAAGAAGARGSAAATGGCALGLRTLPNVELATLRTHDARQTCPDVYKGSGPPPEGLGREGQPWWTALRDFVPVSELEVRPCPCMQCMRAAAHMPDGSLPRNHGVHVCIVRENSLAHGLRSPG